MSAASVFTGIGGLVSTVGQIRQGNAAANAANYNASMAEQNAAQVEAQAAEEERRSRLNAKKELGSARANYGASGVQIDGSALDVLQESAANAELDALTIKHSGAVKAQMFRNEAALSRYEGKEQKRGSRLAAAATLANTASEISRTG